MRTIAKFPSRWMAAILVACVAGALLVSPVPAGADPQGAILPQAQCIAATNLSVTQQYDARPIPGMTLGQVLAYFDQRAQCGAHLDMTGAGASMTTTSIAGNTSGAQSLAATTYETQSKQVCSFVCNTVLDNFIVRYQGTWAHNGSTAIGSGRICNTVSTAFTVSVTWDECDWVYNGGSGYPNGNALLRARWHQTITVFWVSTSYYYWYWLNAYPNGTYQFGCTQC